MADYKVTDTQLTNIANAIRTKGGTSEELEFPTEFISAVNAISGVTAADEGKVVSNGVLVAQQSGSATANGTVDTTIINSLSVNVPQTVVMPISLTVTPPTKTEYEKGDTLDLTGIAVVANYSDGTNAVVTGSCSFSPDDGDTLDTSGDVTITATYNGTGSVSGGSYSVQLTGTTSVHVAAVVDIVPWATGTDEQIAAMVAAMDAGTLSPEDTGWHIGDERTVALSAMPATYVGESHAAQSVTLVIMDSGKYNLVGGGKDHFVVGQKQCLNEDGYVNSSATNSGSWGGSKRRSWCNDVYRNAIPETLRGCFKQFEVITTETYNGSTLQTTTDYFALFAEKEVLGSRSNSNTTEAAALTQVEYYKTAANRVKKINGSTVFWWERSPNSNYNSSWCGVSSSGSADFNNPKDSHGISPFGCL